MMRSLAGFALLLFSSASGQCCINEFRAERDMIPHSVLSVHLNRDELKKQALVTRYERETAGWERSNSYEQRNDFAASMIRTGDAAAAIPILEALERERPSYQTATNLGTAYELTGNIDKALEWIRTGFSRNPDSHRGTEWLHIRILEIKKLVQSDPKALETLEVLAATHPSLTALPPLTEEQVTKALEYQLAERLYFVRPPDPLVGELLVALANRRPKSEAREAVVLYNVASLYEPARPFFIQWRDELSRRALESEEERRRISHALIPAAILFVVGFVVVRLKRRLTEGK